jgi:drug/metabolite transporter (DMT)-like permease
MSTPAVERPGLGPLLALASAALFGASPPAAKQLLAEVDPWLLAGLLYLGAGLGLAAVRLLRQSLVRQHGEAQLGGRQWLWLGGAIAAGGVAGPVLLLHGLAATPASTASLLLNLEGVLTALIAWFVFRENVDQRIAVGMAAITAGAALLAWQGGLSLGGLAGPLAIAGACLAWALDNNLTRKVALADPVQIAMLKGLAAGTLNLTLALAAGASLPALPAVAGAALLGLLSYGVSLVLFVSALRRIGTARTGAYYSVAPFVGAVLAVLWLGEALTLQLVAAGLLMALGVYLHLTERHEHEHEHEALSHAHRHVHDRHHRHVHAAEDPAGEPHIHVHAHTRLRHSHAHYPDSHHRHPH